VPCKRRGLAGGALQSGEGSEQGTVVGRRGVEWNVERGQGWRVLERNDGWA